MHSLTTHTSKRAVSIATDIAMVHCAAYCCVSVCTWRLSSTDVRAKDPLQCSRLCALSRNTMQNSKGIRAHVDMLHRVLVTYCVIPGIHQRGCSGQLARETHAHGHSANAHGLTISNKHSCVSNYILCCLLLMKMRWCACLLAAAGFRQVIVHLCLKVTCILRFMLVSVDTSSLSDFTHPGIPAQKAR